MLKPFQVGFNVIKHVDFVWANLEANFASVGNFVFNPSHWNIFLDQVVKFFIYNKSNVNIMNIIECRLSFIGKWIITFFYCAAHTCGILVHFYCSHFSHIVDKIDWNLGNVTLCAFLFWTYLCLTYDKFYRSIHLFPNFSPWTLQPTCPALKHVWVWG